MSDGKRAWYTELNGYHWLVLSVSTMAWAFDCLSQQIFNLTRKPAMDILTGSLKDADFFGLGHWLKQADFSGPLSTTFLLVGWATGGIIFGIMGDRLGRAKTLTIMILCYSMSTGLCGLSQGVLDYLAYCFITGVGAGGIFPIACTLVAESLPDSTRPQALGAVQTFSALGNIGAGMISLGFVALLAAGVISTHWRWMFSVGILPSLVAIIVAVRLREPESWKRAKAEGRTKKAGLRQLFAEPRWRRNAIVGLLLAASGVVGLWGIGVFSNDLTQRFIGAREDLKQQEKGEPQKDLQFVAQAIASAENLAAAKKLGLEPKHLLGEKDREVSGKKQKDVDAQVLYATALKLSNEGRTVTSDEVLKALDQADADRKAQPGAQAAEERTRRAAILKAAASATPIEEHVDRILTRQKARNITVLKWAAWTLIMFNVGAFFGMYAFARVARILSRRATFAIFFVIAMTSTAICFAFMSEMPRDLWMVVLMGGAQLSVFGGYAIYFPELFPTRLRSTGASFCYNVGRYVSALGPLTLGTLTPYLSSTLGDPVTAARYAGVTMCSCYLVGLVALLFAPETKGQPLPE